MIEEQLRAAFARKEAEVPAAARLVGRIDSAARRRRRARVVLRSGAAALAVVLALVGTPILVRQWARAAPFLPLPGLVGADPLPAGPVDFLILGLDGTASTPPAIGVRADTILVAHVPADHSAIQLVSIPRDLREVVLPAPDKGFRGGAVKMADTYALGGTALLRQHVEALTGVTMRGTVTVELPGLAALVDTLGGVEFCLDRDTVSIHTGRTYLTGCRTWTGSQMRDLLRQRVDYPGGALDRDRHSAQFLIALVTQVMNGGALADLNQLSSVYDALRADAAIDAPGLDLVEVAWELRKASGSSRTPACRPSHCDSTRPPIFCRAATRRACSRRCATTRSRRGSRRTPGMGRSDRPGVASAVGQQRWSWCARMIG